MNLPGVQITQLKGLGRIGKSSHPDYFLWDKEWGLSVLLVPEQALAISGVVQDRGSQWRTRGAATMYLGGKGKYLLLGATKPSCGSRQNGVGPH